MASGNHPDIVGPYLHVIANWTYADATARLAATGFVASDKFKWARQTDDGTYWELTDDSPITWEQLTGAGVGGAVTSVNGATGAVTLDSDDIDDSGHTHKFTTAAEITKLAGIEALADVTDAANVNAAGAVMNTDTTTAAMDFVIDEDSMASNLATKVPTQQSVKAYVDSQIGGVGSYTDEQAQDAVAAAFAAGTHVGATVTYTDGSNKFDVAIVDEYIQDIIGALVQDSSSIDATYNDGGAIESLAIIDEYVQDLVGAMFTDSTNIDVTYNDAGAAETIDLTTAAKTFGISFIIDGGGSAITAGIKGDVKVESACTIVAWEALADQTGSIVVDIWGDSYANFPPVVGDSICGAEKPTISSATKGQDTSLNGGAGWAIAAGTILRFNADATPATITRCTIALKAVRT